MVHAYSIWSGIRETTMATPTIEAHEVSAPEKNSDNPNFRHIDVDSSWDSEYAHRLQIFSSPFGFTTQWLVDCTVLKSHTTPLKYGQPVTACIAAVSSNAKKSNMPMSLCVGLESSLWISSPGCETVEKQLKFLTPSFRMTDLFPLPFGLLVEMSIGDSTDLRRRYYALHHFDEELIHLAELDDKDRVIFVSQNVPLLVTQNHRYLKVWSIKETPREDHESDKLDSARVSAVQQNAVRSAVQLRLLHIQTEDSKQSPGPGTQALSFLVHDLCARPVLCLVASGVLSAFSIGLSDSGDVDDVSLAYRIENVKAAIPLYACRRVNRKLDLFVQTTCGKMYIHVAQNRICQVLVSDTAAHGSNQLLASDSLSSFLIRLEGNTAKRYELRNICFVSKLVNRCILSIACVFFETGCLERIAFLYSEIIKKLSKSSGARVQWDEFVDVLLDFSKQKDLNEASFFRDKDETPSYWDKIVAQEAKQVKTSLSSLPLVHSPRNYERKHERGEIEGEEKLILSRVLRALHLTYEDRKLNCMSKKDVVRLESANRIISIRLRNLSYFDFYSRDNGSSNEFRETRSSLSADSQLYEVPSIFDHLMAILKGTMVDKFPYLSFLNATDRRGLSSEHESSPMLFAQTLEKFFACLYDSGNNVLNLDERAELLLTTMVSCGFQKVDMDCLPFGVAIPLVDALWRCRRSPKRTWKPECFLLIGREDLLSVQSCGLDVHEYPLDVQEYGTDYSLIRMHSAAVSDDQYLEVSDGLASSAPKNSSSSEMDASNDGCETTDFVYKLRFGEDRRLHEVRRMLRSTTPIVVSSNFEMSAVQEPDSREFEAKLAILLRKRLASPVGRGAFTLRTFQPEDPTKPLFIPEICMTGHLYGQRLTKINLSEATRVDSTWGEFHNGVAIGLRLAAGENTKDCDNVQILTRSWIMRHKPSDSPSNPSHAGMLLALGLGKFLPALRNTDVFQYLLPRHDLTSIGLMLGLSSGNRGSMHEKVSNLVQMHVRAFNESGFTMPEFNVSVEVQTAAIVSLGLLYEGSCQTFVLEGLLLELARCARHGDEVDGREGLSLAAGISIGLVCLGRGEPRVSISKGKLVDRLACFANGDQFDHDVNFSDAPGSKSLLRTDEGAFSDGDRSRMEDGEACRVHQIGREQPNIDVVAPGALLALGLMYLKTNNEHIAKRIRVAKNFYDLDQTRPDHLYLQILCRSLILWDSIRASREWVLQCLPPILQSSDSNAYKEGSLFTKNVAKKWARFLDMDSQGILHSRAFGITGACTAIALRFAGSVDEYAVELISQTCEDFEAALLGVEKDCEDEEWVYGTCLTACCLALGVVCAGSGDLGVLRLLRRLRKRCGPSLQSKRYGRFMGMDMAVGFVFLGGGCQTFGSSKSSIASLICAIYPRFPDDVGDNQYHLQAFRHLYVLAVEPRCLETRDVDTDSPCQVDIEVHTTMNTVLKLKAPCIVPEASKVRSISVVSDRYWPTTVEMNSCPGDSEYGWFSSTDRQIVYVKRRPGHLSHLTDPKGSKGILARSLRSSIIGSSNWDDFIQAFSADPEILALARLLRNHSDESNNTKIICESLATDRAEALRFYYEAHRALDCVKQCRAGPETVGSIVLSEVYLDRSAHSDGMLIAEDDLASILSKVKSYLQSQSRRFDVSKYERSSRANWPQGRDGAILSYILRSSRVPQLFITEKLRSNSIFGQHFEH